MPITTWPSAERVQPTTAAAGSLCESTGTVLVRPNRALSLDARRWVAVSLCLPVLLVAAAVTWHGGWLILPFAGAEVLLIVLAYRWLRAGDDDFESIRVDGDRLVLSRMRHGERSEASFNLHWLQVEFVPAGIARKSRLALRSHGRVFALGELMTDDERSATAAWLTAQVRRQRGAAPARVRSRTSTGVFH